MGDWDDLTVKMPTPHGDVLPERDASSIGNLLRLDHPELTTAQIQHALAHQQAHPGMRLGEALVALGYIAEDDVVAACHNQELLRTSKPSEKRTALIKAEMDRAEKQVSKLDTMVDGVTSLLDQLLVKLSKR